MRLGCRWLWQHPCLDSPALEWRKSSTCVDRQLSLPFIVNLIRWVYPTTINFKHPSLPSVKGSYLPLIPFSFFFTTLITKTCTNLHSYYIMSGQVGEGVYMFFSLVSFFYVRFSGVIRFLNYPGFPQSINAVSISYVSCSLLLAISLLHFILIITKRGFGSHFPLSHFLGVFLQSRYIIWSSSSAFAFPLSVRREWKEWARLYISPSFEMEFIPFLNTYFHKNCTFTIILFLFFLSLADWNGGRFNRQN